MSGSVLDNFIEDRVSDSAGALVKTIGSLIVGAGAGADEDRLFKFIGKLGPRAEEAISLIQNPALFPQVAYNHLQQTGVISRLTKKAEQFGQGVLDKIAGRVPPAMHGIGALPPRPPSWAGTGKLYLIARMR